MEVAAALTNVHRIKNNKVLLENARGEDVYRKSNKLFIVSIHTRDKLAELDVPCFCALQSDSMTTSLITSDVCIETPKVNLYDPLQNILFLQLLLNTTTLENVTLNMIPYLNMPELITDFDMDDDKQLLHRTHPRRPLHRPTAGIKASMRDIHTSIVSQHLAARDNNKILRTHPP